MPIKKHNNKTSHQTRFPIGSVCLARGDDRPFHIAHENLAEHFYIIGRSGSGKSNFLKNLAVADIKNGAGLCFIDPLGDTAEALLSHIPHGATDNDMTDAASRAASSASTRSRDKDVIYIDLADTEYPIGINPLYNVAPEDRARTVSDILQMFEGIWHDTGWGPRMESIFRAALHTLVENPDCMRPSLLTVFRLLLDEEFRAKTKQSISNRQVLDWWNFRFDRGDLNERTRREWIEPVLNKIDKLSLDPVIRNIIGQPRCALNFEEIIRRKQILIVNLNQNKIGLDNAAFVGMLIISQIRQAAAKVGTRDNPFALSIDEAHSFPTMELTKIINQGRHAGLFARIAHQNLDQFDTKIGSAFRNGCGSLAIFALGNKDAETIVDDIESQHRDRMLDLIRSLGNGQSVLRLSSKGAADAAPSYAVDVALVKKGSAKRTSAINFTRQRFATDRLTAAFQIENSHGQLDRDEYLKWKTLFRVTRKTRSKTQKQNERVRKENRASKTNQMSAAFESLGDFVFRPPNHLSP